MADLHSAPQLAQLAADLGRRNAALLDAMERAMDALEPSFARGEPRACTAFLVLAAAASRARAGLPPVKVG